MMNNNDSAKKLFAKGEVLFQQKNYKESMNILLESQIKSPNNSTAFYICSCMNKLKEETNTANKESTNDLLIEDIECEKILRTSNYYFLLQITKDSSPEIIKKAYKELALKFHPDKNHSSKAGEAFEKICTAYQTMINGEKREIYDRYGESGLKTNQTNCNKNNHEYTRNCYNRFRKCYYSNSYSSNQNCNKQSSTTKGDDKNSNKNQYSITQVSSIKTFLPLIIVCGVYLFAKLFKTVNLFDILPSTNRPLYQFDRSTQYYIKKITSMNSIEYYIGDAFLLQFPKEKDIKESQIEIVIEREFLLKSKEQCFKAMKKKKEIEYDMTMNNKDSIQINKLSDQLKELDKNSCRQFKKYFQLIQ